MAGRMSNSNKNEKNNENTDIEKMTPEGVEGYVNYKGDLQKAIIHEIIAYETSSHKWHEDWYLVHFFDQEIKDRNEPIENLFPKDNIYNLVKDTKNFIVNFKRILNLKSYFIDKALRITIPTHPNEYRFSNHMIEWNKAPHSSILRIISIISHHPIIIL